MTRSVVKTLCLGATILLTGSTVAFAQDSHGSGGESGCGDLFGDLVEILRDEASGVPILEKRSILLAQDVRADAYCPVGLYRDPVAGTVTPVPFVIDSCDFNTTSIAPIAVDYFGRLSAGRTKERNIRMHFDEVIDKIKGSEAVWRDVMGRLNLGTDCSLVTAESATCATWTAIDSPVESLSVYQRLAKYGHIQTSPVEVDTWVHGDPNVATTQYHPALSKADWDKFVGETRALLTTAGGCATATDLGTLDVDDPCFAPQALGSTDLVVASALLGTAADKTGKATVDLVQYMNRILKIPVKTPSSKAPAGVLKPLYRECVITDPVLDTKTCGKVYTEVPEPATSAEDYAANPWKLPLPPTTGTDPWAPARERFISFAALEAYDRAAVWPDAAAVIRPASTLGLSTTTAITKLLSVQNANEVWVVDQQVSILDFLNARNPGLGGGSSIAGFVNATNDAIRTIEFVHNYRIPENLTQFEFAK